MKKFLLLCLMFLMCFCCVSFAQTTLIDGPTFNTTLNTLAGDLENITAIKQWVLEDMPTDAIDISKEQNDSIKAWYHDGTIYYYSQESIVMSPDSSNMFKDCSNLSDISVLSTRDANNVTSLYDFFNGCSSLIDVSAVEWWDTSNVTDMRSVFYGIWAENIDLSNWDTNSVILMNNMFQQCKNLKNIDLSNWDTSNVTNMRYMFAQMNNLKTLDISSFDTSNVEDMTAMFFVWENEAINLETIYVSDKFIVPTDVSKTDMMFKRQTKLVWQNGSKCTDLCEWEDTNGKYAVIDNEYIPGYLTVAPNLVSVVLNYDPKIVGSQVDIMTIAKWDTISEPNIPEKSGFSILWWYDLATDQNFDFDMPIIQNTTLYAKYQADEDFATLFPWPTVSSIIGSLAGTRSNIVSFIRADKLNGQATDLRIISIDWSIPVYARYDTETKIVYYYSEVEKIYLNADSSYMFENFTKLVSLDTSWWDTSKVTSMEHMFSKCNSLVLLDVSWWDTSEVVQMWNVFRDCWKLQTIKWIENWNTSQVTKTAFMFLNCNSLIEIDLSNWDTSNVSEMQQMFARNDQPADGREYQLQTIYVWNWFITNKASTTQMFGRAKQLVWWNWTTWLSLSAGGNWVWVNYAKIDKEWQVGLFTDRAQYAKVRFMDEWVEIASQLVKKWSKLTKPALDTILNQEAVRYTDDWLTENWDFDNNLVESDVDLYAKWECVAGTQMGSRGVCVLTVAEDQRISQIIQDLDIYFIDSSSNVYHETLMDRNMWATAVYTWESNSDTYWYYYQRWNNYGFSYDDIVAGSVNITDTQISYNTWSKFPASTYATWSFVIASNNWHQWWTSDSNLRWWARDSISKDWVWTKSDRQWPCPDWYYVPSVKDLNLLLDQWKSIAQDSNDFGQFAKDLLLPLAWHVSKNDWSHMGEGAWYIWSSSPARSDGSYRFAFTASQFDLWGGMQRSSGDPVRCFKNVDNTPLIIEPNGWEKAIISIVENRINLLWTPIRGTDEFLWWYTTPDFQEWTKVATWDDVNWVSGLYAKWEWVVKFENDDWTVLFTSWYINGTDKSVLDADKPSNPTKSENEQYTYVFSGWTPEFENVTKDITYKAEYTPILRQYTITFVDESGVELLSWRLYDYGTNPDDIVKPSNPSKQATSDYTYTFAWWSPALAIVTWNTVYKATYNANMILKWGWAWIWDKPQIDDCPNGDFSPSYYDWICGEKDSSSNDGEGELQTAYDRAYQNGITTINVFELADPDWYVKRWHMAKMVVNFVVNVLWKIESTQISEQCKTRNDEQIVRESQEIRNYADRACALWIMWIEMPNQKFRPNDLVSRAEFGTIVSRIIWWDKYNTNADDSLPYYENHLNMLKSNAIMTQIENPLTRIEIRKWAWLIFKRVSEM